MDVGSGGGLMEDTAEIWGAGWTPGVGQGQESGRVSPEQGPGIPVSASQVAPQTVMVSFMCHLGQASVLRYVLKPQSRGCYGGAWSNQGETCLEPRRGPALRKRESHLQVAFGQKLQWQRFPGLRPAGLPCGIRTCPAYMVTWASSLK